jgi:hypothetical protein|tara:strand:- start:1311 stop:1559 length:249 start_codon:yes stop_codon:yes gene_type:complete
MREQLEKYLNELYDKVYLEFYDPGEVHQYMSFVCQIKDKKPIEFFIVHWVNKNIIKVYKRDYTKVDGLTNMYPLESLKTNKS